jgi:Protein of unknown function (DUF2510)
MSPMYEFDAVSVSSFEAASLAVTLTEKSADGWDVVAVVPAGSDVVAYLRRSTAAEAPAGEEAAAESAPEATAEPADEDGTPAIDLLTPASSSTSTSEPAAASTAGAGGAAGWGAGTDSGASSTSWGGGTATGSWSGGGTESSWGGSAQQQQPAAATSTPSVPAGWYADPAGRFELRYWDGNAWTEHVSRGGQQYTDPPVA